MLRERRIFDVTRQRRINSQFELKFLCNLDKKKEIIIVRGVQSWRRLPSKTDFLLN